MNSVHMTDGSSLQLAHDFGDGRAILIMRGAFIMGKRVTMNNEWEEGEPARPGLELDTLNALIRSSGAETTTVIVTKDDDSEP